jgi:hypothetical protein
MQELSPHPLGSRLVYSALRSTVSNHQLFELHSTNPCRKGMISMLSRLLGLSLLFCLGLPFALFALLTTGLALGTLLFRVLCAYLDLFLALVNGVMSPSHPAAPLSSPNVKPARRRKHATPPTPISTLRKTPSFASLVGSGTDRDFEGVGGWRFPESADEEAVWLNINKNLELPASPALVRKHRRTGTGTGSQSPVLTRTVARTSGSASPEGYFSIRVESREGMGMSSRGNA